MSKKKGASPASRAKTYAAWRKLAKESPGLKHLSESEDKFIATTEKGQVIVYNHSGKFGTGLNHKLSKIYKAIGLVVVVILMLMAMRGFA